MPRLNAGDRDQVVRMIAVNVPVWDRKQTGLHSQCKVTTEAKRKNQREKKLLFVPLNRCDGLIQYTRFLRWVTDLVIFVSCKQQNAIQYPHLLQRVTDLVTFTSCKQQNASQYPHFLQRGYPVSCILYGEQIWLHLRHAKSKMQSIHRWILYEEMTAEAYKENSCTDINLFRFECEGDIFVPHYKWVLFCRQLHSAGPVPWRRRERVSWLSPRSVAEPEVADIL